MLEYRHLDTRYVKKTLYCCYSLEKSTDFAERVATNHVDLHDPSRGTDPNKECLNAIGVYIH